MAFVNLLMAVYPVGSIYASTVSTSPANIIGGTWAQITNAAIRAATSTGYVGSDTHTLTVDEIPSHRHTQNTPYYGNFSSTSHTGHVTYWSTYSDTNLPVTSFTGGGGAHSILQRSYNCYVWYRTA